MDKEQKKEKVKIYNENKWDIEYLKDLYDFSTEDAINYFLSITN